MNSYAIEQNTGFLGSFLAQVYGILSFGLFVTFGIGFLIYFMVQSNPAILNIITPLFFPIMLLQFLFVLVFSFIWRRLSAIVSSLIFFIYSCLTGIFMGVIMIGFEANTIVLAFGATTVTFIVMALYGYFTKQDLTRIGNLALMGLIGLIIASVFNIFAYFFFPGFAEGFYWVLTYLGLGIFLVLVAYDTQKLKQLALHAQNSGEGMSRYAIQGALMLYLDFINLFIRILAIMGRRR